MSMKIQHSSILVVIQAHVEDPQQHLPILLVIAEGNNPVMTISHTYTYCLRRLKLLMCLLIMLRWWSIAQGETKHVTLY